MPSLPLSLSAPAFQPISKSGWMGRVYFAEGKEATVQLSSDKRESRSQGRKENIKFLPPFLLPVAQPTEFRNRQLKCHINLSTSSISKHYVGLIHKKRREEVMYVVIGLRGGPLKKFFLSFPALCVDYGSSTHVHRLTGH